MIEGPFFASLSLAGIETPPAKSQSCPMTRARLQGLILFAAVALLLAAVVRIYQIQVSTAPPNLEGHIAVEGGMTANPPSPN